MAHLFGDPEFWVLVAVAVFAALVWKPAKRVLVGALDGRATRIREELDAARNLREEAQRMLADYQQRERAAVAEAEQIIAHARAEAERITTLSARAIEETLERRRRLAEERIAQEEAKALAEIRAVTVDVAIAAARQIIAAELDESRAGALIDTAITALPHQLQ